MIVDDKIILHLAELAKLEFSDVERIEIKKDLEKIFSFMEQLKSVNTDNVEPLIYVNDDVNVVREDIVVHPITKDEALSNAPIHDSDYIKVPKFVTHRS
ncbi:MAG: Asp-tRNA(Asn)/Glu-tRNA(Gln) amidotransferase subunit GatC [Chitinophagales bacterium]|nr:Asp-tRNA(Asn)/Glu-tRNA(Gln) amidotransferase subunit GatC [Chitinophagales bacterium]MCZ2392913.1 Asp-tRNA(Asn)/Glu-tRNA(Gln) amidotransferase subunit GatC [Chitinophagales bacterium]